jgi:hypothetical protein
MIDGGTPEIVRANIQKSSVQCIITTNINDEQCSLLVDTGADSCFFTEAKYKSLIFPTTWVTIKSGNRKSSER